MDQSTLNRSSVRILNGPKYMKYIQCMHFKWAKVHATDPVYEFEIDQSVHNRCVFGMDQTQKINNLNSLG